MTEGTLEHNDHIPHEDDYKVAKMNNVSEQGSKLIQIMFDFGLPKGTIASIMNKYCSHKNIGCILPKSVYNHHTKLQNAIQEVMGISADMSVARKTIMNLHV